MEDGGGPGTGRGRPSKIAAINGLRGIAIVGVIWQHIFANWFSLPKVGPYHWYDPLVTNGWTGVNLFFILSGFVLFLPYAQGSRSVEGLKDVFEFYRHRFFRLMPLYYVAALLVLVMAGSTMNKPSFIYTSEQIILLGFLTNRYGMSPPINYPLWSIGVELEFSILFPIIVALMNRMSLRWLLTVTLAFAFAARIGGRIWDFHRLGPNSVSDNIFGRIDEFVLGMAMATTYAKGRIPRWARHLKWSGIALILLSWEGFYPCQYGNISVVWMAPLNNVLDAGICLVLLSALEREERHWSVLSLWPLQVMGVMCYSIYIWHAPVLENVAPRQGIFLSLLLVAGLAAMSYRFIEFGKVRDWKSLFLIPGNIWSRPVPPVVFEPLGLARLNRRSDD